MFNVFRELECVCESTKLEILIALMIFIALKTLKHLNIIYVSLQM